MANKDYYNILGIEKNASKEDIKKAFHKLAHKYHPDKKGGDEAKFKEVNEAYQTLSDDQKRAQYDQFGGAFGQGFGGGQGGFGGFGGFDFSQAGAGFDMGDLGDIFSEFFGGGVGGGRAQARRGRDISTEIQIPFKEAIFGTERTLLINKVSTCDVCQGTGGKPGTGMKKCGTCNGQGKIHETKRSIFGTFSSVRPCEACHGSGEIPSEKCANCRGAGVLKKENEVKVVIPAGIKDGEMIRMTGMGEAIPRATAGDLYIKVNVLPHKVFRREGNNLIMDLDVKLSDALLGTEYTIETLEVPVKIKIPEGVSIGEVLRVKDLGVPYARGKRGDILIKPNIKLPNKLSRSARELIEKLKGEGI